MKAKTSKNVKKVVKTPCGRSKGGVAPKCADDLAGAIDHIAAANRSFLAAYGHDLDRVDCGASADERKGAHGSMYAKALCLKYLHSCAGLSGLHDVILHMPRTDLARKSFAKMVDAVMGTLERIVAVADSMEAEDAASAAIGYFNRWGSLWKMDGAEVRVEVEADWRRLKEAMRGAENRLKEELWQAVKDAKARQNAGGYAVPSKPSVEEGGRLATKSGETKERKPEKRRTKLRRVSGIAAAPYAVDVKENGITRRATGKKYIIAKGQSSAVVNRLVHGMVKGIRAKSKEWFVKFSTEEAHDMGKAGSDTKSFLVECIVRKSFSGHKIGNVKYENEAQLIH